MLDEIGRLKENNEYTMLSSIALVASSISQIDANYNNFTKSREIRGFLTQSLYDKAQLPFTFYEQQTYAIFQGVVAIEQLTEDPQMLNFTQL